MTQNFTPALGDPALTLLHTEIALLKRETGVVSTPTGSKSFYTPRYEARS